VQKRNLLVLVAPRAVQDVVEDGHGVVDEGSFVEHDAFGAVAHRGVGDLGSGGLTSSGQLLKHLGRPDNGKVGGFADPEDLLLEFGEALVAALDREVAASDRRPRRAGSP
jgi:hypothetical protein